MPKHAPSEGSPSERERDVRARKSTASRRAWLLPFWACLVLASFKGLRSRPWSLTPGKTDGTPERRGLTGRPASCFASWAAKGRCGRALHPRVMMHAAGHSPHTRNPRQRRLTHVPTPPQPRTCSVAEARRRQRRRRSGGAHCSGRRARTCRLACQREPWWCRSHSDHPSLPRPRPHQQPLQLRPVTAAQPRAPAPLRQPTQAKRCRRGGATR